MIFIKPKCQCSRISLYKKTFLEQFNLKTKPPKKDTCHKYDIFKTKIDSLLEGDEQNLIILERDKHQRQAEEARDDMNLDLKLAEGDEKTENLTFDMEKTLPLPRLTRNIIFYKRQLWLYNCSIYVGKQKIVPFMSGLKVRQAVVPKRLAPA